MLHNYLCSNGHQLNCHGNFPPFSRQSFLPLRWLGAMSDFDGMGDDFIFQATATGAPTREGLAMCSWDHRCQNTCNWKCLIHEPWIIGVHLFLVKFLFFTRNNICIHSPL